MGEEQGLGMLLGRGLQQNLDRVAMGPADPWALMAKIDASPAFNESFSLPMPPNSGPMQPQGQAGGDLLSKLRMLGPSAGLFTQPQQQYGHASPGRVGGGSAAMAPIPQYPLGVQRREIPSLGMLLARGR